MAQRDGVRDSLTGPRPAPFPAVSVVIPTYNRAATVVEAVESALAQTVAPAEVIVVDDGSTDGTRERLAPYAGRIVYLRQENKGVSAARNAGVGAATGELIAFLDSDDVWHPRKLEVQLHYLLEHPETALVGAAAFTDSGRNWPGLPEGAPPASRLRLAEIVLRSPFPTSAVVVRKSCLDAVGDFDTGLRNSEDRDLYIRVCGRYPVASLGAVLVWGREGGEHLSMGSAESEQATRQMLVGAFQRVEALRGRSLLRRKALSHAAFEASYLHLARGDRLRALGRLLRSFALWPFALPGGRPGAFPRLKRLVRIVFPARGFTP
jgi:glycosyltransferase involved in cell wall biosynthesis